MFIIDPDFTGADWAAVGPIGVSRGRLSNSSDLLSLLKKYEREAAEGVGYVLPHGGRVFQEPVVRLSEAALADLETVIPYLPGVNRFVADLARAGFDDGPKRPQWLLCETAFFTHMPDPARVYALPYEYDQAGLNRLGGDGLLHAWAWERSYHQVNNLERLVSVCLGERPNLAAIQAGRAVDSSMGYPPVGGIPSAFGCGELDPSVSFAMQEAGLSADEIETAITQQSGWKALAGKELDWEGLANGHDLAAVFPRQVVTHALVQTLGAGFAALGEVDAVHFACPNVGTSLGFIEGICRRMAFAGIDWGEPVQQGDLWLLSRSTSRIQILASAYDRPVFLAGLLR